MDQIKIGRFIAERRKACGLTQRVLAERLSISDKTVSKWECGNGLPEVSLMLPLCEILGISVNELLTGEILEASDYKQHAEENMMKLMKEKQENKKKIILSTVVAGITVVAAVALFLVSGLAEIGTVARIVLIAVGGIVMLAGIGVACVLDRDAGVYECRKCGAHFVPDMTSYMMAPHTLTARRLRCPECGKKSYCRKRLGEEE